MKGLISPYFPFISMLYDHRSKKMPTRMFISNKVKGRPWRIPVLKALGILSNRGL